IGRDATERIYFRALTIYMNPSDNFMNARQAVLQSCADLYGMTDGKYASIQNAFAAVGIGTPAP
ncbi:MAG: M4 family metallopeptidase, partial [Candidatus Brocadiales bacterium]